LLDLNFILLFIATASPLVLIWRLARLGRDRPAGWMTAAITVLLVGGISYLLLPAIAGYVAGVAWALLLLAPSVAERQAANLLINKRYWAAKQLAIVRQTLHPWHQSDELLRLTSALELARNGHLSVALASLAAHSDSIAAGRAATAVRFALQEDWDGLLSWSRRDLKVTSDPTVRALYLRALGEMGALEDLAWSFAMRNQMLEHRSVVSLSFAQELLYLFAFCGRQDGVVRLMRGPLKRWPRSHQDFWIGTAELTAGKTDPAIARLTRLRGQTSDAILDRALEQRLARAKEMPVARPSAATARLLDRLVAETGGEHNLPAKRPTRPVAVWILIGLNIAMFCAELALGGSTNDRVLRRLGALETNVVAAGHQYWRLLTSLFLHYGFLHISVNLYALYLLGPALERMIGSIRFAIGYLISGLGSGGGVVLFYAIGLTRAQELVGASGCVMGVIGMSAGLLLRHRQSPLAGRRLLEILAIVFFQTIFDLLVPQVSLGAHLCGFLTGLLVGIIFANRCTVQ
jgi:rhomboid protease GluP